MTEKRQIEDYLPVKEISYEATREKVLRRREGHISTLHIWWARRPLAAARAAVLSALVPAAGEDERAALGEFYKGLCHWGDNDRMVASARDLIRTHWGRPPRVLDMFAGGGAIPLEALRLGCEVYALDLNPVAYLLNLCTVVYPQRYGRRLAEMVEKWGRWVVRRVMDRVGDLYPPIPDPDQHARGARQLTLDGTVKGREGCLTPIAYLWTRTVPCPNPALPPHEALLVRQTWLVRKPGRYVALRPIPDREALRVRFEVVESSARREEDAVAEFGFDPGAFSRRGNTTCLCCGAPVPDAHVKAAGMAGRMGQALMAVACWRAQGRGKVYLSPEQASGAVPDPAAVKARLEELGDLGLEPPSEPVPLGRSQYMPVTNYGLSRFADLFTPRQQVLLLSFAAAVCAAHEEMIRQGEDPDFARAVATYLALAVDRVADRSSTLCHWDNSRETTANTYARQALPMVWDFSEVNPFGGSSGDWEHQLHLVTQVIAHCTGTGNHPSTVYRGDATRLPLPDGHLDAIVTDPPYYDNIPYADLSDFFYVWLKRSIGGLYPEHFASPQTPKKSEIVSFPHLYNGDRKAARTAYEDMLTRALTEAHRVLRPGGILVVVYAHKTTAGWATLVDALRRARFTVTGAWPLDTEMPDRVGQMDTASLASSFFLAARKREGDPVGDYARDVLPELQHVVRERVRTLSELGIAGADLVIAAVGAGLQAFTRYARVELPNGEELPAEEFLATVQREVTAAILERILNGGGAGARRLDRPTQYYLLARYQYGTGTVHFDDANTLARGVGVELDGIGGLCFGRNPLVRKVKDHVSLRDYLDRGSDPELGLPGEAGPAPLVDVLHRLTWLAENEPGTVPEFLDRAAPDAAQLRLLAQALAGPALSGGKGSSERSREQAALDRLLAAWRRLVDEHTIMTRRRDAE